MNNKIVKGTALVKIKQKNVEIIIIKIATTSAPARILRNLFIYIHCK